MSSTTVRSKNNQIKTEVTGMGIVFNTRENKYEIEVGQTLDTVLKDHIQTQGEMGIGVENGYVEKSGNSSKLVTANGSAFLEFNRELLFALNADSDENINANYQIMKKGLCPL